SSCTRVKGAGCNLGCRIEVHHSNGCWTGGGITNCSVSELSIPIGTPTAGTAISQHCTCVSKAHRDLLDAWLAGLTASVGDARDRARTSVPARAAGFARSAACFTPGPNARISWVACLVEATRVACPSAAFAIRRDGSIWGEVETIELRKRTRG